MIKMFTAQTPEYGGDFTMSYYFTITYRFTSLRIQPITTYNYLSQSETAYNYPSQSQTTYDYPSQSQTACP